MKHKIISKPQDPVGLAYMLTLNNEIAEGKELSKEDKQFWNKNISLIKMYYRDMDNYWAKISSRPLKIK